MTLLPGIAFSQTDSLICLPIPVIDQTILELQELDYLRDKSTIDSALILSLRTQNQTLRELAVIADSLNTQQALQTKAYANRLREVEVEKRWWQVGTGGVTALLILSLLL